MSNGAHKVIIKRFAKVTLSTPCHKLHRRPHSFLFLTSSVHVVLYNTTHPHTLTQFLSHTLSPSLTTLHRKVLGFRRCHRILAKIPASHFLPFTRRSRLVHHFWKVLSRKEDVWSNLEDHRDRTLKTTVIKPCIFSLFHKVTCITF